MIDQLFTHARRTVLTVSNGTLGIFLCLLLAGILYGCQELPSEGQTIALEEAVAQEQPLLNIRKTQLPNMNANIEAARKYYEPLDSDSIEMFEYRGSLNYHPVGMIHRSLAFLAAFHQTKDKKFLERAEKYTRKLSEIALETESVIFLPYRFRFAVHSDSNNTFEVPWYSGMAQGEFLLLLSRMYEITSDKQYLRLGEKTLNSLALLRNSGKFPWVSRIDSSGFFWIEEYPHEKKPGQTLNGFIAAIYGLYDFYRVTKSPLAKRLYDLSLTTIKHYVPYFRVSGKNSWYCLAHGHPATDSYHRLHINMLSQLYIMTGDPFFLAMKDVFEADSNRGT